MTEIGILISYLKDLIEKLTKTPSGSSGTWDRTEFHSQPEIDTEVTTRIPRLPINCGMLIAVHMHVPHSTYV